MMFSEHAQLLDCVFTLGTMFKEDPFAMNCTTNRTNSDHFDYVPCDVSLPAQGVSAV